MGKKDQHRRASRPGISQGEVDAAVAARDAAIRGNPKLARAALLAGSIKVGAIEIPPLSMGRVLILEEIGSPLAKPGAAEPTNEQVIEAIFAISRPAADTLEIWRRGRDAWRMAIFAFSDTIPIDQIADLGAALGCQIKAAEQLVAGGGSSISPASSGEDAGAGRGEKKSPA